MSTLFILILLALAFYAGWRLGRSSAVRNDQPVPFAAVADDELSDELVAVIGAAAAEVAASPVVVKRIQFLGDRPSPAWAVTGRLNIMASHQISRRTI
jgi:hypothetical protein